jgi:hypothetical protein
LATYDKAIPPGGVGRVTLEVDTTNLQGSITKSANVYTSDSKHRIAKIAVTADIQPILIVEPAPRVLLSGIIGDDIRRTLRLRTRGDYPLRIEKIESNLGSLLNCKLDKTDEANTFELEITCKAKERKSAGGYLTLHTNHPKKRQVKLPVFVRTKPELEFYPAKISFKSLCKNSGKAKRVLILVNHRGKGFHLRDLRYNEDHFEVRALQSSDRAASKHRLEITPLLNQISATGDKVEDTLIIHTDLAHAEEVHVPMEIRFGS